MNEKVLNFIKKFQNEGTIKTFSSGCCYWFAAILDNRFNWNSPESGIMYNEIDNHFACWIEGKLYDITGEIELNENWEWWNSFCSKDDLLVSRIVKDCIEF